MSDQLMKAFTVNEKGVMFHDRIPERTFGYVSSLEFAICLITMSLGLKVIRCILMSLIWEDVVGNRC